MSLLASHDDSLKEIILIYIMKSNLVCTSNGSPACGDDYQSSYHDVYDIPMKEISRPLLPTIDENKVQSLMETIQVKIKTIRFI